MQTRHWNIAIGLLFIVLSLVTLIWWIPNDIETGVIFEEFRDVNIGDAMAPTASALAVLIFSIALVISSFLPGSSDSAEHDIGVSAANSKNILSIAAIVLAGLLVMVWAGPVLVAIMQAAGSDIKEYRLLINTVPHKYTGFALGGFLLVAGLISWIEGRVTWQALATAAGAVIALIVVYDLPFDTLLLPPNGEQ